ncbi:MAG: RnfABCDGE type electron transport complex subunit D [Clostridia bacterium]|nr:RnfABCDGE type electron transport complex subunit D [Clostridia bacterium]
MSQLIVSTSPHIHSKNNTTRVMLNVIIALLPAITASVWIFGWRALLLVSVSVATAVLSEILFNLLCKKSQTIYDLSAVVTGILLALNVPVTLPVWQMVIGSAFAIIAVKGLFGGIGQNFANPAITARIMMLLSFSATMSPKTYPVADVIAGSTPLNSIRTGELHLIPDTSELLLGRYGGSLGETCSIALLLGGAYMLIRHIITWHAPVAFIGTVFLGSFVLGLPPVVEILSGGLLIGAIFMATDYSTTPITKNGRLIFGLGCGIITLLIRKWGSVPEGVSYAILFMNILTPYIEKWTVKRPLGGAK